MVIVKDLSKCIAYRDGKKYYCLHYKNDENKEKRFKVPKFLWDML